MDDLVRGGGYPTFDASGTPPGLSIVLMRVAGFVTSFNLQVRFNLAIKIKSESVLRDNIHNFFFIKGRTTKRGGGGSTLKKTSIF